ncbi:MAG TPA: class II aldolase/adducin family protein [Candidatus Limnocylindrales bacterium]
MDSAIVDQVIQAAAAVLAGGAISHNGHGNVSLRVPGEDEMYFTSAPSLRGLTAQGIARVGLDGALREGSLPPIQGAVVAMHTAMYADHPEVGCVVHTHAPFATAFAVANEPIGCWVEALAMFGLPEGVPIAAYAPRGSEAAVASIRQAVLPGNPAVLLANHGVLVFHRNVDLAVLALGVVEEAAQAAINARGLGGPVALPEPMRAAALQRAMLIEATGTRSA